MNDFFDPKNVFLVVGASNNPEKYGAKVFLNLKAALYKTVPINSHESVVYGEQAYPTMTEYMKKNKKVKKESVVLVLIIPPNAAFEVVKEAKALGITKAWFQPGAESEEAIKFCEENGVACSHHACIMLQRP